MAPARHVSCSPSPAQVINETPDPQAPVDEAKLRLIRDFFLREFRDWRLTEYFDAAEGAMVFRLETEHGRQHTLVVPLETFKDIGFLRFCNAELVAAIKLAPWKRFTLTPDGVQFH
jgi:hypothetical protein